MSKVIELMLSDLSIRTEGLSPSEFNELFRGVSNTIAEPKQEEIRVESKPVEELVMELDKLTLRDPEDEYISNLRRPRTQKEPKGLFNPFRKPHVRLVFFKCPECMEIFASLIDLNSVEEVACRCGELIPVVEDVLVFGSYECPDCDTTGKFLMQPTVPEVKCRNCDNKFYMIQDSKTKDYRGKKY